MGIPCPVASLRRVTKISAPARGVDVVIVGGGAIGVSSALELAKRGASVAILEQGEKLASGCSAGNAGIVGVSHVLPLANPTAVRDGVRWMARPDSPFFVRPRPAVLPWLARFTAAAAPGRVRRSTAVLRKTVGHVVVAAGVWSARLTADLGLRLPIEGGKGYHVDVPARATDPELPIWLHERRVVITPLNGRVRFAGTLELTGTDLGVDGRRVDAISDAARRALPSVGSRPALHIWRGLRPCTPDGLPIIGPSPAVDNAVLATGHGMWGCSWPR
jgi:glycine/D-amino acid oxidase-like deaminating enzyme